MPRKERRKDAAAAVTVDRDRRAALRGVAHSALVQLAANAAVDLQKGIRPRLEMHAALVPRKARFAVQQAELPAENAVAFPSVHVLPQRKALEFIAQKRNQPVRTGQAVLGGDGGDDEVPFHLAHDDVAQNAAAVRLVISPHAAFLHVRGKGGDDLLRPVRVNGAAPHGHDAVAALGVKADDVFPVFIHAHGDLQFVAVLVLEIALDGERHIEVDARNFAQGVPDRFALELELRAVAQVLQLAAAALGEQRAARPHTLVGGREDFQRLRVADAVFHLQCPEFDLFPHRGERGEKHRFAHMYDPFAVAPERLDQPREFAVLFHDLRFFRHFPFSAILSRFFLFPHFFSSCPSLSVDCPSPAEGASFSRPPASGMPVPPFSEDALSPPEAGLSVSNGSIPFSPPEAGVPPCCPPLPRSNLRT